MNIQFTSHLKGRVLATQKEGCIERLNMKAFKFFLFNIHSSKHILVMHRIEKEYIFLSRNVHALTTPYTFTSP